MPSYLDYHGLQTFKGELDQIFATKQDKPLTTGTPGQVLGLNDNLSPVWLTPQGGGGDASIDDTAGAGDTDKAWSADKLTTEKMRMLANLAPNYDDLLFPISTSTWCEHEGQLYIARQDIATSEEWTPAHWVAYSLGESEYTTMATLMELAYMLNLIYPVVQSSTSNVGKALSPKTVSGGVVTQWQYLDIESGISLVETVTGTTPTITGQPNVRYMCGEVATLNVTPPVSGTIDVIFESGSTATVLTVPSTVMFPSWFDADNLDADTIYEIMITDGVYGAVMSWAN